MSSYRFCRTDDIPLLVDALNRCWQPSFPAERPMTIARFKREIRDLQVWCSSCMVAFAGADPIGVLIGAKRAEATLVHRIAVHPDYRRQGHGRHFLTSLSSKLSILGPPRIVAEIPGAGGPAHDLLAACGFRRDACYTDFVLDSHGEPSTRGSNLEAAALQGRFVIPVTVDDLAANGLLTGSDPQLCWDRSAETLTARREEISGLAVATDERIEAYVLYTTAGDLRGTAILAVRSLVTDHEGLRARLLIDRLIDRASGPFQIGKVHPEEIPAPLLERLGFHRDGVHVRYAATARGA